MMSVTGPIPICVPKPISPDSVDFIGSALDIVRCLVRWEGVNILVAIITMGSGDIIAMADVVLIHRHD